MSLEASPSHEIQPTKTQDFDQVHQVLYLLDKFAVSDEVYHELQMLSSDLPPTHRVKQARKTLNESVTFERLPPFPGAYRSFEATLIEQLSKVVHITAIQKHNVPHNYDMTQCVCSLNFNPHLHKITYYFWQVKSDPDIFNEDSPIQVKLSGDRARFSRTSNFILLSFSFPSLRSNVLSGRGTNVVTYNVLYIMYNIIGTCNYHIARHFRWCKFLYI